MCHVFPIHCNRVKIHTPNPSIHSETKMPHFSVLIGSAEDLKSWNMFVHLSWWVTMMNSGRNVRMTLYPMIVQKLLHARWHGPSWHGNLPNLFTSQWTRGWCWLLMLLKKKRATGLHVPKTHLNNRSRWWRGSCSLEEWKLEGSWCFGKKGGEVFVSPGLTWCPRLAPKHPADPPFSLHTDLFAVEIQTILKSRESTQHVI